MNRAYKIFNLVLMFIFLFSTYSFVVYGRTVDEVQKEIELKKKDLTSAEEEIKGIEGEIGELKQKLGEISGKRGKLQAEISINEKEAQVLIKKIDDLEQKNEILDLEKEQRIILQDKIVTDAYLNWKQNNFLREILKSDSDSIIKTATYQATMAGNEQKNIENLEVELLNIEKELVDSSNLKSEYEKKISDLDKAKKEIESELYALDSKIRENEGSLNTYRARVGDLQSQINQLTAEQKAIMEQEKKLILGEAKYGGNKPIKPGQVYFQGVGRELYQGHGVGMSQFGALGAALNGWDYKKIVEFYYPGAKVVEYKKRDNITVDGFGSMSIEDYVAGAGEVPDYACEDLEIEFDPSGIWKCWPKESIKAQAVAFRTYGIAKTEGGGSICTSAKCQVYKGGQNKAWAAEDTKYEVLVYDGKPISAYYSADNHNGWGTANNDTVWSNFSGVGTPEPYLRAVNDSAITFKTTYTTWGWRTNGYDMAQLDSMLVWSTTSSTASQSYKDFLTNVKGKIGTLKSISFDRDPSGRVKRVLLVGDKGSEYVAGWLFKSIFNIWIGNENPSGQEDYLFSLSYDIRNG